MSDTFFTLRKPAEGIYKEKMSKFLSFAHPVTTVEEAKAVIAKYQKEYFDARHVCWAYMIGAERKTFMSNDNGEPSGTAGRPILGQINSFGLTNIVICVVRYFGGIKLGTGGLVRAYTGIAKEALKAADVAEVKDMEVTTLEIQYTYHGKAENMAQKGDFIIRNTQFTDKVTLEIVCDPLKTGEIITSFMEVTAGTVNILDRHQELEKVKIV